MSQSGSGYWIQFLEGVELLIQMESRSANFGAKLMPSLNGADPGFMISVTGSVYRVNCSNILQDNSYHAEHMTQISLSHLEAFWTIDIIMDENEL